jgi:uncharacterized protein YfkK (UPF0435 family)
MNTPDREPVGQGVNYILSALDIIANMALDPEQYDEVAAEEIALGQIISRAQLILSFIDARRKPKTTLRVMQ